MALPRDRYVIRSYSPMVTIGGGELLDVAPPKARRSPTLIARLRILETGPPAAVLEAPHPAGRRGRRADARSSGPARRSAPRPSAATSGISSRASACFLVDREWYVHADTGGTPPAGGRGALAAFHAREPLKPGMSKEELRTRLGGLDERVFLALLDRFVAAGALVVDKDKVRGAGHAVRLTPEQQAASDRLEAEFREAGVAPPSLEEAFAKLGLAGPRTRPWPRLLLEGRASCGFGRGSTSMPSRSRMRSVGSSRSSGSTEAITPQEIKDLLGITRKYAIPLLSSSTPSG